MFLSLVSIVLCVGCVRSKSAELHGGADVLREDDIEALHAASAYDVVLRTHVEFIRGRGRESLDPRNQEVAAHVFMDDTFYGDINTLKAVPASQLAEIHFYKSYEAQYKFGTGHIGGVVQLITKQ
ncbi:MAG: hypothetical protein ABJC63_07435 [Gemmatimonadales bacterium]